MNGLMPRKAPVEQLDLATADEGGDVVCTAIICLQHACIGIANIKRAERCVQ